MHIQFHTRLQCIQISTRINSSSVHTYIFVFVSFETYSIFNKRYHAKPGSIIKIMVCVSDWPIKGAVADPGFLDVGQAYLRFMTNFFQ